MKLFVIFPLVVAMVASDNDCVSYSTNALCCSKLEVKADESINVDHTIPTIHVWNVSGSLGIKTFSQMSSVKLLSIGKSRIDSIEDGALCSLPSLEELQILNNDVFPALTKSLLIGCDELNHLFVSTVTLDPRAFESMPNLETLILSKLHFSHFTTEYLQSLTKLDGLEFSECKLEVIDAGSICSSPNLKKLDVYGNYIPQTLTETMFENCNKVEILYYRQQVKKSTIQDGTFSGFVNLKTATIYDLDIGRLSKGHLRGLKNIENLILMESNIKSIDEEAFGELTGLRELSLGVNNISGVVSGVFAPLTKLVALHLNSNKISQTGLDSSAFMNLTSLVTLDLGFNEISRISSDLLTPLTSLIKLFIRGNRITSIDDIRHSTLEVLDVSENLINVVDAEAVKLNLPNLKHLIIFRNNMTERYLETLRSKLEGVNVLWYTKPYSSSV